MAKTASDQRRPLGRTPGSNARRIERTQPREVLA